MRVSLCIWVPTASSPLLPKSCHLLYPRILCTKQRPLIHPDTLLTLPLLLFLSHMLSDIPAVVSAVKEQEEE